MSSAWQPLKHCMLYVVGPTQSMSFYGYERKSELKRIESIYLMKIAAKRTNNKKYYDLKS